MSDIMVKPGTITIPRNATYDEICEAIESIDTIDTFEEFCHMRGNGSDGAFHEFVWQNYNEDILKKLAIHYGFKYKMFTEGGICGVYYEKSYPDRIIKGCDYVIENYGEKGNKAYCFKDGYIKYYSLEEI